MTGLPPDFYIKFCQTVCLLPLLYRPSNRALARVRWHARGLYSLSVGGRAKVVNSSLNSAAIEQRTLLPEQFFS